MTADNQVKVTVEVKKLLFNERRFKETYSQMLLRVFKEYYECKEENK